MEHKAFASFMTTAWQPKPNDFCGTMREFQTKLEEWRKHVFGSMQRCRSRCIARLNGVQNALSQYPSKYLSKLELELRHEFHDILAQEIPIGSKRVNYIG